MNDIADDIMLGFVGLAILVWLGILLLSKAWPSTDFDKKHLQGEMCGRSDSARAGGEGK